MKTILSIIGARPQFIKHAPVQLQLQKYFKALTVHTGQHYDSNMSNVFFKELDIPEPDYLFDIGGSKSQGEQTAIMMIEIEKVCSKILPDAVLVYGDTNSTLAAVLVSSKMNIPIIHIEAGLRSYNRSMPEEINRIVADEFSQLLFCPTIQSIDNLEKEGISHNHIYLSGDVMCDTLHLVKEKIQKLYDGPYYFATLHRPYNTDTVERLGYILLALNRLDKKVIFPIHPRTVARMQSFGLNTTDYSNILFINPTGYVESLSYQRYSNGIITDSGGMQKEAYMLKKKCVTVRTETEWTETLSAGWNTLMFDDLSTLSEILSGPEGEYDNYLYGDGHAAEEIAKTIKDFLSHSI
jgi:UDP-GlcNAc3NAcA epimerase